MATRRFINQGRNQTFSLGGSRRQKRLVRGAEGVEGMGNGEGYPPPQPTRGSGSVVIQKSSTPGPRPKTILVLSERLRTPLVAKIVAI